MSGGNMTGRARWDYRDHWFFGGRILAVLQVEVQVEVTGRVIDSHPYLMSFGTRTWWRDASPAEHSMFDVVLRPTPGADTETLKTKQG